ncbi:hypothetical protein [Pseudonocardia nigra]|uniref:hypothetical protein n=1 Tax=Pseudonocardia nigra TaxID=1921578 RepID=UPI001C5F536D|nr:hypothetical protein [Pseudonocardia nigra]
MSENLTLLEFIRELLFNVEMRDYFAAEPEKALEEHGLGHLTADDVHDALVLINEEDQDADFSREYNTGGNHVEALPIAVPAAPAHHGDDHGSAIEYINRYITNNHVDDRDTTVDNSVNQQIDTDGGDFDQDIDIDSTVASGDGAVAAGDDIEDSTIVTGDDNQVGDGNVAGNGNVVGDGNQAVTGNDNTTSFGSGDANSVEVGDDLTVGDGAGFATGGSAWVDNSDHSQENVGNDYSDNSKENVGNDYSDNSDHSDNSVEDSYNDFSDNSNHSDNSVEDSFNDDVDVHV